jgi:alkanesulfonate monooxygenase SsuD/methylene tetrahydromethanopterin reductase-like flavin-dependent oxidoreductase (luciferase family)
MEFAHFSHVWAIEGMSAADRYELLMQEIELCDELGFDYTFCVEHHFTPHESLISSPSLFTAAVAQRTKRIRLGPMGYVAPLYQPLRLHRSGDLSLLLRCLRGRLPESARDHA